MKKKVLMILFCGVLLFGITGCNGKQNNKQEYTESMNELREYSPGYLEGHKAGELLDVALEDAKWTEDEKYSISSGAVIVTGKDKKSGEDIKLIWLTTYNTSERVGFEEMTKGNSKVGYSEFLDYLKDYIEE